jgi:Holliday junction DNA helicase RuvA
MINYLKGTACFTSINPITLLTGGVGYAVHVGELVRNNLTENGAISLYIHTHVREDQLELFGFITSQDLKMFELLLSVSGIGPKTALLIVDRGTLDIQKAVYNADVNFFTGIPRLGKKNAQKIIIELKNKLGSPNDVLLEDSSNSESQMILDALQQMGFSKKEIQDNFRHLTKDDITISDKIKRLLRYLGKN